MNDEYLILRQVVVEGVTMWREVGTYGGGYPTAALDRALQDEGVAGSYLVIPITGYGRVERFTVTTRTEFEVEDAADAEVWA